MREASSHPPEHGVNRGTTGKEPPQKSAQPDQHSLDQRNVDHHSIARDIQDSSQQASQAGNITGGAGDLDAIQVDQEIVTNEERVESEWLSDQEMLDEMKKSNIIRSGMVGKICESRRGKRERKIR